jgi:hypothetical protein
VVINDNLPLLTINNNDDDASKILKLKFYKNDDSNEELVYCTFKIQLNINEKQEVEDEEEDEDEEKKMKNKKRKKTFEFNLNKCNICQFVSMNDASLKEHIKRHHINLISDQVYTVMVDILNGIEGIETIKTIDNIPYTATYKCHLCNNDHSSFVNRIELQNHFTKQHSIEFNSKSLKCFYCQRLENNLDSFFNHLKKDHQSSFIEECCLQMNDRNESKENTKWWHWFQNDSKQFQKSTTPQSIIINEISGDEESFNDNEVKEILSSSNNNNNTTTNKRKKSTPTPTPTPTQQQSTRTYTCQMCKKQFDQRADLSKHQCIELHLKILKKKKEIRKKKWRESHWKHKIDLSYIETTSLTSLSQNIADNLSYCIDGTQEDMRAYAREVKDYLNTELGNETQIQMFIETCLPELITKYHIEAHQIDEKIFKKAASYFINCYYLPTRTTTNNNILFCCKNCRLKFKCLSDLIYHQRKYHFDDLISSKKVQTTFDCFNNEDSSNNDDHPLVNWNVQATEPVGFNTCDPISYIFNLYWDKMLKKECSNCHLTFNRSKYRNHIENDPVCGGEYQKLNENDINGHCKLAIDRIIKQIENEDDLKLNEDSIMISHSDSDNNDDDDDKIYDSTDLNVEDTAEATDEDDDNDDDDDDDNSNNNIFDFNLKRKRNINNENQTIKRNRRSSRFYTNKNIEDNNSSNDSMLNYRRSSEASSTKTNDSDNYTFKSKKQQKPQTPKKQNNKLLKRQNSTKIVETIQLSKSKGDSSSLLNNQSQHDYIVPTDSHGKQLVKTIMCILKLLNLI